MIAIQFKTTRLTVTEANAAKYRAIIDSGKLPKIKMPSSTPIRRTYPRFWPGMTTAEYLDQFAKLNGAGLHPIKYIHADREAPSLDATQPEVLEEIDPDYVEQPVPVKVKKRSPAKVNAELLAMVQRLYGFALHYGSQSAVDAARGGLLAQAQALIEELSA